MYHKLGTASKNTEVSTYSSHIYRGPNGFQEPGNRFRSAEKSSGIANAFKGNYYNTSV
jgi:hypothetical protein